MLAPSLTPSSSRRYRLASVLALLAVVTLVTLSTARAQDAAPSTNSAPSEGQGTGVLHPALFLVGDSIMQTGSGNGDRGPWGWGSEIGAFFDPAKIHVYNEARGGRSSRSYIEEGWWTNVLARIQPGDFVILQFGHNDSANSDGHPNRATITGAGDETIQLGIATNKTVVHSYGWYLRQYVADAKAKGATPIICSPVPRNSWTNGKIKRGFDGYARWAADAAKAGGAFFIDLNTLAADRFDAFGQEKTATYFNDFQHTKKIGAKLNAQCVVEGIKQLKDCPLASYLLPPSVAAANSQP
ncbi:MAG: rhamnogalacturonan acetylesterase [Verrucomicrobiia bacterium]|jgi:lysophospholipase L1-like esterase